METMIGELKPQLVQGFGTTLKIFILTLIMSIPLGLIIALGRISKLGFIRWITGIYVLIMRGTPLMLQIIFIFFGLPLLDIGISRFPAAILALVLNYGAYFAEIFRYVLGLSNKHIFFRIILPQAFKRILPPVSNEIITLVKDTALIYVVGLDELLKVGTIALNRTASLFPLVIVGAIYLLFMGLLTKILSNVEKKLSYYE